MTVHASVAGDTAAWLTDHTHWIGADGIPHRLLEHVGYSALTVALSALVAVPLGLWIGHTGRGRSFAVAITGALRALPTLGLLTWFVLLAGIGLAAPTVALVILAIPPLLAAAYSGLESLDRQTVDAARAQGMTEWQILFQVELPLALPLLVGGLRSATLQVVATLSFTGNVDQIYDVAVLPGCHFPELIEPGHPRMRNHFCFPPMSAPLADVAPSKAS